MAGRDDYGGSGRPGSNNSTGGGFSGDRSGGLGGGNASNFGGGGGNIRSPGGFNDKNRGDMMGPGGTGFGGRPGQSPNAFADLASFLGGGKGNPAGPAVNQPVSAVPPQVMQPPPGQQPPPIQAGETLAEYYARINSEPPGTYMQRRTRPMAPNVYGQPPISSTPYGRTDYNTLGNLTSQPPARYRSLDTNAGVPRNTTVINKTPGTVGADRSWSGGWPGAR